jgi:predicted ATP-dependent endonuclease of OLD family
VNELKLSLQNFQSISEGELTFKTGLNFIIGQSNSGKSATFRALKACLLNPAGSQRFIKRDSGKTTVILKYNGNDICWNKTEKANSYSINGEEYRNTGKSDAFKILNNDTGFVKAEKGCALMNIEEELQLPFPFGIPDSELFKLFENVFCVSDSAVILKSAKEHEDKVKSDINLLELEKTKVQTKLDGLAELKEEVSLSRLEEYKKELEAGRNRLIGLKEGLPEIKLACKLNRTDLNIEERKFEDYLSPYFEKLDCKKAIKITQGLHKLLKEFEKTEYTPVSKLKELKELKDIQKLVLQLKKINRIRVNEVSFDNKIEKYLKLTELNKILRNLKKLHKIRISEKSFEDKQVRLEELKSLKAHIGELKGQIQELKANKKREEEKVASIEAKLKEFKVCPLCHRSLED